MRKLACLKLKWLSWSIKTEADKLVAEVLRRSTPKKPLSTNKGELGIPLCAYKHFDNGDQLGVNDVKLDLQHFSNLTLNKPETHIESRSDLPSYQEDMENSSM